MVFPIVMYGWESWTIKKAEHQRIDAFELWCWRKVLQIHWKGLGRKEIRPENMLEGLKLKLQSLTT